MNKIKIVVALFAAVAILLAGIVFFKKKSVSKPPAFDEVTESVDFGKMQELTKEGHYREALDIFHSHEHQISAKTAFGQKWYRLLGELYAKTDQFGALVGLYEAYPFIFEGDEKGSSVIAYGYILARRSQDYWTIRETWRDRATLLDTWMVLDVDALLLDGKKEEALKLLKSRRFEGKHDIDRLVRLALFYVVENPKLAWDYLSEAYNLDPQNPDIMSYRGKLLESMGQSSLALYEYMEAVRAKPENLFLRDQLAEFYMRQSQVALALSVWLETLSKPSLDLIWVKVLFWSKVITPVGFDWTKAVQPTSDDKPFIEYLASLPNGVFWDEAAFEKLSNQQKYLRTLQVTFWLRLLESLKQQDEDAARKLLGFNLFSSNSMNPSLERALKQTANYRKTGFLNSETSQLKADESIPGPQNRNKTEKKQITSEKETFFNELNSWAEEEKKNNSTDVVPPGVSNLLKSEEGFSALFLSAGWLEAALQLHKISVLPEDFPEWVAYGLTQAIRINRSSEQALDFALKQKKTAPLSILIAELYMAVKKPDEALSILEPFAKDPSYIGYQSSWLIYLIYVDKRQYEKAKEVINANPKLADDVLGKEALARLALLEGDITLADNLYSQLEDKSPEAVSYLARKAFSDKDWVRAQELTQKLILLYPDDPTLRDNLNKIIEEQKRASSL